MKQPQLWIHAVGLYVSPAGHKISMSSHKDVKIWMDVSTGAPLSTQHFLCNTHLMKVIASRSHHRTHSSVKIVLLVHTFKLCCRVCNLPSNSVVGHVSQNHIVRQVPSNHFLGCILLQIVSFGAFHSSLGAEYSLAHLQIASSWCILFKLWSMVCFHAPSNWVFWCIPFKPWNRICCHGHQMNYIPPCWFIFVFLLFSILKKLQHSFFIKCGRE
jgi:hypothetical protein